MQGLDTGPMLAQRKVTIGAEMNSAELHGVLAAAGAELLLVVIEAIVAGTARATPQPAAGASYAAKLEKREALIDWNEAAPTIARQVRGCNPWPVAQTLLDGEPVKIWRARGLGGAGANTPAPGSVLGLADGRLEVQCGEGRLAIEQLQCAGRRALSAADFAHGHAIDGLRFG